MGMSTKAKKPIPDNQTTLIIKQIRAKNKNKKERKVFDLIPERDLELKELTLGYEKAEGGLRMQVGPPLLSQKWEALG